MESSKHILRFDGKIRLIEFDNFSRENTLVNLWNQNKHCDLTGKIRLLESAFRIWQFFSSKFFGQQKLRFDGYIQVLDNKRLLDTLGRVLYWGCVVKMQDFW